MNLDFYHITQNDFVNAMKLLLQNKITTTNQLQSLSIEKINSLKGIGDKKRSHIELIQKISLTNDVFEHLFILQKMPNVIKSIFSNVELNPHLVLTTKLSNLAKQSKMTPGKTRAFTRFKNYTFRYIYNNTLPQYHQQSETYIIETLTNSFLSPLRKYIPSQILEDFTNIFQKYIKAIGFKQVDLDLYTDDIVTQLDYETILMETYPNFNKELLYLVISNERKDINQFQLKKKLEQLRVFNMNELQTMLNELVSEGFLIYTEHGVKSQLPKVIQYIEYHKENKFPTLYYRIKGKTLEEIGHLRGVTRERIRQLSNKEIKELPLDKFYESNFKIFFQSFELTKDEFCHVFGLDNEQYNFLKLYYQQDNERFTKEDLLEHPQLNNHAKERLLDIINKDFILINNHRIKPNKTSIISYTAALFAKESIHLKEYQNKLVSFCKENKIDDQFNFKEPRALEGIISRHDNILWKLKKMLRYYEQDKELILLALSKINFNRYLNQEITTRIILQDYEYLFNEIDIQDEYELHNLLKKYSDHIPEIVKLRRMPGLEVGRVDREEQVLNFLIEHSPIPKDTFIKLYSEKYGTLPETFKANYLPMVREYENGDILDADTPPISEKVLNQVRSILTNDFYFKEDIHQLYKEKYKEVHLKDYMYPLVGYTNFAQFILKDTYTRADAYFEEKYFKHKVFRLNDNRINYLGSYRKRLEQLRNDFELFEFGNNEFISLNLIREKSNIDKNDIKQLVDYILDEVGDKFFTVPMVSHIIEDSKLYQLGFEDIFYESLLKGVPDLRYNYIGGIPVFRKTENKFYIQNFIQEMIIYFKQIDIYDFIDYLFENYSINLSKSKIIQAIENTELYFHPIMEMLFQDVEQFYELMEDN